MYFQVKQIKKLRSRSILLTATGFALMLDMQTVCAQTSTASVDKLEEIVITAEKRTEDLQKTSISVAVLKGDDLVSQGKTDINEALRTIPGVQVQGGAATSQIYIRGVGPNTIGGGGSTTTTQTVDDVFLTDQSSYVQFDVGQVEVLKGPQGTLQGSGSTGGSVLIRTADPTETVGGQISLQGGNYSAFRAEGAVNMPLTSTLLSRVSFLHSKRDGYYSNGAGDEDINAGRLKFLFKPIDDLSVMLAAEYDQWKGKGDTTADAPIAAHASNPYQASNPAGGQNTTRLAFWGHLDWNLGWGVVTFVPSWYNYKVHNDLAFISKPSPAQTRGQQSSQELRLGSPDSSALKWVLGLYHLHYLSHTDAFSDFLIPDSSGLTNLQQACAAGAPVLVEHADVRMSCSGAVIGDGTSDTQAIFSQVTYPLTDSLRVLGGLRYTKNKNTGTTRIALTGAPSTDTSTSNSATTWKTGLEYDVVPQSMLYATVSTAARAGGINMEGGTVIPGVGTVPSIVAPEKVTAYELGSKNRFMDDRLEINGAAFYYTYKDMQATVVGPSTPATAPRPTLYNVNGDATIYGAEAQIQWLVTPADRLSVSAVYSHATWDSLQYATAFYGAGVSAGGFPPGGCNVPGTPYGPGTNCFGPGVIDRSGVALTLAPEWTESLGYEHSFNFSNGSSLAFNGSIRFVSEAQTTVEPIRTAGQVQPETNQEAYHKSDARLTYTSTGGTWTVSAFVNNIENIAVKQFLQGIPAGPPGAAPFNPPIFRTQLSPPRTYGLNAGVKF